MDISLRTCHYHHSIPPWLSELSDTRWPTLSSVEQKERMRSLRERKKWGRKIRVDEKARRKEEGWEESEKGREKRRRNQKEKIREGRGWGCEAEWVKRKGGEGQWDSKKKRMRRRFEMEMKMRVRKRRRMRIRKRVRQRKRVRKRRRMRKRRRKSRRVRKRVKLMRNVETITEENIVVDSPFYLSPIEKILVNNTHICRGITMEWMEWTIFWLFTSLSAFAFYPGTLCSYLSVYLFVYLSLSLSLSYKHTHTHTTFPLNLCRSPRRTYTSLSGISVSGPGFFS